VARQSGVSFECLVLDDGSQDERSALSWIGRLKAWAHGGRQAFVTAPDACHACQLCVEACPEEAIGLAPNRAAGSTWSS
jgi:NAD-dependent dihydropyrimidine dehydrogenase PreA subunit